jgi:hypothetical protein
LKFSILKTARKLLNLKQPPLTAREGWAATFDHLISLEEPRTGKQPPFLLVTSTDCMEEIPLPKETQQMWRKFKKVESTPETEENIRMFLKARSYDHMVFQVLFHINSRRKCLCQIGNNNLLT